MFLILLSMVFNHFGQAQKIVAVLLDPEFKSVLRSQRSVYIVNVLNSGQNVLH